MEAHLLRRAVWAGLAAAALATTAHAQVDPGVRGGTAGAGSPFSDLTTNERSFFEVGLEDFEEAEGVGEGMGPRFNLDGCAGCHMQPAVGGTSPAVNPQVAVATAFGAQNTLPSFITLNGPVREARFKTNPDGSRDGGVHALFTIRGRVDSTGDASGCTAAQEDFATQVARNNVIFRIPTPTFGAGLMEMIPDQTLINNVNASPNTKASFGISGRLNRNGNDGTVSRFGWKAQNESLLLFSGEAYNVEMGISNELFQVERDENATCQFASHPNDVTNVDGPLPTDTVSAVEKFAFFMRFLAPPTASTSAPGGSASIGRGRSLFSAIGCALCHTPTMRTGASTVAALSNKDANLFSDLALHAMGPGLADNVLQGGARGDEFRTAPLWGLGQRIFFLHDGRTSDLRAAIAAHRSNGNSQFGPSEANTSVNVYNALGAGNKQDVLNFLRSL
ncbi:MAG TPA: di-heme oxidoredictase family protein [Steroidobacteraceae bacterium]|nr:di-heme oxidoredictase family protein [Steroidobacteraceae bacterium]